MSHELKHSLVAVDSGTLQLVKDTPLFDLIKPLQEEILLDDRCIAGTTHLPDQSCLEELKPGDWLIMEREDNPWDEHAILLRDSQRRKCGYIPANENVIFARLMDAGKLLKAKVVEKGCPGRKVPAPAKQTLVQDPCGGLPRGFLNRTPAGARPRLSSP